MPLRLRRAITELARTPRLLVSCDYDGILTPAADEPSQVRPDARSVTALCSLAALSRTTCAVFSDRALSELAASSRLPGEVHLVGSHSSEFELAGMPPAERSGLERLRHTARNLVRVSPAAALEESPAGVAVWYSRCDPTVGQRLLREVLRIAGEWNGVHVTAGEGVVGLSVVSTGKDEAFDVLRRQARATAAMFLGGAGNKKVFARLSGPDLGVRVGESSAEHYAADPAGVATVLTLLLEERRTWLHGGQARGRG